MTFEEIKPEAFQVINQTNTSQDGVSLHLDDGFLYGLGFFETINILEGACFLKDHVDRINESLKSFGIARYVTEACVNQLIQNNGWQNSVLKIVVTPRNALAITRPNPYTDSQYQSGFSLTQSSVTKSTHSVFIGHKSLNYGENLWARQLSKKAGYDDCLFSNEYGNITESTIANLFIIEGDQLITPPLSEGLLPGIIRCKITDGFSVRQEAISPERLMNCDGAFLTNSVAMVMRVSAYVGLRVPEHPMIDDIRSKVNALARKSYVI